MTIAGVKPGTGISIKHELFKVTDVTYFLWSEIHDVIVWVYGVSGSVIQKYSLKERTGHDSDNFEKVSETNAIFNILMTEEITRKARKEKATLEIKFWVIDENWPGGYKPFTGSASALSFSEALTKFEEA